MTYYSGKDLKIQINIEVDPFKVTWITQEYFGFKEIMAYIGGFWSIFSLAWKLMLPFYTVRGIWSLA